MKNLLIRDNSLSISSDSRPKRSPFQSVFVLAALALMLLPFITTFNSFLTNILLKWQLYRALEDLVVPYQAKMLSSIVALFPFPLSVAPTARGIWLNGGFVELQWNCLGWQSAVLFVATILTGFQGNFTFSSRAETVIIGFLGTYFVNILRMIIVVGLTAVGFLAPAVIFHDYLSLLLIIVWFFLFWWFSYSFVLEAKEE